MVAIRLSAGLLLYRRVGRRLEVLLAHPGGPFFARSDKGAWTIPKGEPGPDDAIEAGTGDQALRSVAVREFGEETGQRLPDRPATPLGSITQRGGKVVHAWAMEGDLDPASARSNTFTLEWPSRSGRLVEFPEIDRVAWFDLGEAHRRIRPAQAPFLDRLAEHLEAQDQGR